MQKEKHLLCVVVQACDCIYCQPVFVKGSNHILRNEIMLNLSCSCMNSFQNKGRYIPHNVKRNS